MQSAIGFVFQKLGERQGGPINRLSIHDPEWVWYIEQGEVDVFALPYEEDQASGGREYLFTLPRGRLLFGVELQSGDGVRLGLQGTAEARLLRCPRESLQHEADPEAHAVAVCEWTNTLVHWMDSAAPDAAHGFKRLHELHQTFIGCVASHLEEAGQRDRKRLTSLVEMDRQKTTGSFRILARIMEKKPRVDMPRLEEENGDSAWQAVRLIATFMQCPLPLSPGIAGSDPDEQIRRMAKSAHIRVRDLMLEREWWKWDNGPLLAFRKEDGRPVALLPLSDSRYEMHDPVNRKVNRISEATAKELASTAYMFYRPLPFHPLKLKDLFRFSAKERVRKDVILMIVLGVFGGLLNLAIPLATGRLIGEIIPNAQRNQIVDLFLILLAIGISTFAFQVTRSLAMLRMEGRLDSSLQAAVWDRILNLPVPFFRKFSSGDLAVRANQISSIRKVLSGTVMTSLFGGIFSLFNLILLFSYSPQLTGVALVLVVVSVAVTSALSYRSIQLGRKDTEGPMTGLIVQIIGGMAKIRVAGAENRMFNHWAQAFERYRSVSYRQRLITNSLTTFNAIFPTLTTVVLFYCLVAMNTRLDTGQFLSFQSAYSAFIMGMVGISASLISVANIIPDYERARPILEEVPEIGEDKTPPGKLNGSIEVSHVSFRYEEDGPMILKEVSLTIQPGEFIAIVGTSGSGKSTLLRLLLGFEKPVSGSVYYDNKDLSKLDIQMVRSQTGVVLQNGQLMSGEIYSNIIGSANLTVQDAWEAARQVGLDEDIRKMPMGMFTMIDEGASTISGGQRQRILIARALVGKPSILFFDEATSALDNKTQKTVSDSLDRLRATRIVIAHRLSTVMNADRIYVLDQGRMVEQGTYAELMDRGGIFKEMAERQLA